ncbi:MAG: hypothetical protein WCE79_27930 [Xanthobacteraceae bacterium]
MSSRWLASIALAAVLLGPAAAQETRVHGENSIFASAGVKLGWAVKRGASETETLVIVRVVAADAGYRTVSVDGVDPFTKDRKVFVPARPLERQTDLSIPRAQFSDHPSTEFHFFASAEDAAANRPKLTVFYLGVPDTTPEFADQAAAEAYFAKMLKE